MNLRAFVKRVIKAGFLLVALPVYLLFILLRLVAGNNRCFSSFSQALSLIPGRAGTYLRAAFYKLACPDTSDEIVVGFLTILSHQNTTIRKGAYIGPQCNIGMCEIGEGTLLGSGVHILSGSKQHAFSDTDTPIQEQGGEFTRIQIGKDCWIGNGALLMAPLADKSVVAAGSVVTRGFEAGAVLAGNPAKQIKNRFDEKRKSSENHE